MKLSRQQVHEIKESIRVGSFCKKWWKGLSKEIKAVDLSDFQKLEVFIEMARGLIIEAKACARCEHDFAIINTEISRELGNIIIHE